MAWFLHANTLIVSITLYLQFRSSNGIEPGSVYTIITAIITVFSQSFIHSCVANSLLHAND